MKWASWRQWLVMSVFGAASLLGCNHAEHSCEFASDLQPYGPVAGLPAALPETASLTSPQPGSTFQMRSTRTDTMLQTAAAKRAEAALGTIAVPIVASSKPGSQTGTFVLTAADADAMGVKPGYTPGAVFVPLK
jgi:hypothetical protein